MSPPCLAELPDHLKRQGSRAVKRLAEARPGALTVARAEEEEKGPWIDDDSMLRLPRASRRDRARTARSDRRTAGLGAGRAEHRSAGAALRLARRRSGQCPLTVPASSTRSTGCSRARACRSRSSKSSTPGAKIRDYEVDEGWVHSSLLSSRRTIMVTGQVRELRRTPDQSARVVLRAEPGVIGRLFDCEENWCRIEIEGRRGWLQRERVLGHAAR